MAVINQATLSKFGDDLTRVISRAGEVYVKASSGAANSTAYQLGSIQDVSFTMEQQKTQRDSHGREKVVSALMTLSLTMRQTDYDTEIANLDALIDQLVDVKLLDKSECDLPTSLVWSDLVFRRGVLICKAWITSDFTLDYNGEDSSIPLQIVFQVSLATLESSVYGDGMYFGAKGCASCYPDFIFDSGRTQYQVESDHSKIWFSGATRYFRLERAGTAYYRGRHKILTQAANHEPRYVDGFLVVETDSVTVDNASLETTLDVNCAVQSETTIKGPDGTSNCSRVRATSGFSGELGCEITDGNNASDQAHAFFIKQAEFPVVQVQCTGAFTTDFDIWLSTGELKNVSGGAADNVTIEEYANGWYRVKLAASGDLSIAVAAKVGSTTTLTHAINATGFYFFGGEVYEGVDYCPEYVGGASNTAETFYCTYTGWAADNAVGVTVGGTFIPHTNIAFAASALTGFKDQVRAEFDLTNTEMTVGVAKQNAAKLKLQSQVSAYGSDSITTLSNPTYGEDNMITVMVNCSDNNGATYAKTVSRDAAVTTVDSGTAVIPDGSKITKMELASFNGKIKHIFALQQDDIVVKDATFLLNEHSN